jgi:hypothetical protein
MRIHGGAETVPRYDWEMQNGDAKEAAVRRQWTTEAAGLPCAIELTDDGSWVVTIASASTTRRDDLTAAIVAASGGLVSDAEAFQVAAAVTNPGSRRNGEQLTVTRQRQTGKGR